MLNKPVKIPKRIDVLSDNLTDMFIPDAYDPERDRMLEELNITRYHSFQVDSLV